MSENNTNSDDVLDFIDTFLSNVMNMTSTADANLRGLANFMRIMRDREVENIEHEKDAKFEEDASKYFS